MAGGAVSVADLLISCELEQLRLLDGADEVRAPSVGVVIREMAVVSVVHVRIAW